jgi:hypothetical protein
VTPETPSSPPADASSATGDIARRDSQQLRRSTVGVLGIAFLVISAAAPLTAMAGGAPVAMLLGNGPGIPAAYVVVSVILLIFSVGYTAMARHHTSTGAFYSFVARGLRQPAGGAAAMIALLGYNAMQIGLYGLLEQPQPASSATYSGSTSRGGCSCSSPWRSSPCSATGRSTSR